MRTRYRGEKNKIILMLRDKKKNSKLNEKGRRENKKRRNKKRKREMKETKRNDCLSSPSQVGNLNKEREKGENEERRNGKRSRRQIGERRTTINCKGKGKGT